MSVAAALYLLDLGQGAVDPRGFEALLNEQELLRATSLPAGPTRLQWMCGRAWLRTLLGEHLGWPGASIEFGRGADGKPFLVRAPRLSFNLAHSGTTFACALASDGEIGVDIERLDRRLPPPAHWWRFLSADELAHVGSSASHFVRLWTCKEAVMKADGAGIRMGPRSVRFAARARLRMHLTATGDEADLSRWRLAHAFASNYAWAVACKTVGPSVPCELQISLLGADDQWWSGAAGKARRYVSVPLHGAGMAGPRGEFSSNPMHNESTGSKST